MLWPISPFVSATSLAAAIALATAWLIWRRRSAPGAKYLALTMVAAAEWSASLALESAAIDIPSKVLWSKAEYLGISASTTLLLMFALAYSRNTRWLSSWRLALLWTEPALINLVVWTQDRHGLLWTSLTMAPGSNVLIYGHGPAFYLAMAGHSVIILLASVILLRAVAYLAPLYRLQVAVVALSCVPPWAIGAAYTLEPALTDGMDMTALGFLLTCLLLSWSLLRFQMLDLMPVARDALIEGMSDGVLVLDDRNRIIDVNPATQRLLSLFGASPIGRSAMEALAAHPNLTSLLQDAPECRAEVRLDTDATRYLDLRVSALLDRQRRSGGRLVVMRDVTEMVKMREELRALSLVDELTGLHNRRGFLTLAAQQLRIARRLGMGAGQDQEIRYL